MLREGRRLLNGNSITCLILTCPPLMIKFSKEQAGIQKQDSPMQIAPRQKPTAKSKATKEDKDEEGTKRQKAAKRYVDCLP